MVSLMGLLLPSTHANEVIVRLCPCVLALPPSHTVLLHPFVPITKDPDPTDQPLYSRDPIVFVSPLRLASSYSMVLEEVVSQELRYPSSSPFLPSIMFIECKQRAVYRAAAVVTAW